MARTITVTECMRSFSDVMGRVYYQGEIFDIKKGTNIVARISPVKKAKVGLKIKDLNKFFARVPRLREDDSTDFAKDIKEVRNISPGDVDKWE